MANDTYLVGSVLRAVSLLRCFSIEAPELSVTELSGILDVHKSTVSRLLATLAKEGLVDRDPDSSKYRLGLGLLELAGLVLLHADLRQIARPFLRQLSESTQETVNLAILDGGMSFNLEQAVSYDRRVIGIGWLGRRAPLHVSSTGKVMLAYLPKKQLQSILEIQLARFTEYSITDVDILRIELQGVRERGYAIGSQELEIGMNAVAAPVRDHIGEVIAAVSVTAPPCAPIQTAHHP
ncbi:IclR family transcriptional regulator [Chloroflexota bacterium]